MTKTILYVVLCAAALASGALFAQPGLGVGGNATGNANTGTPATPATPATPNTPATPATPDLPATPAAPATPATPATPNSSVENTTKVNFDQADANADGQISRDEAKGDLTLNSRFKKLDKDRNGNLSMDEYKAGASTTTKAKPKG